jgi:hypothetical protein
LWDPKLPLIIGSLTTINNNKKTRTDSLPLKWTTLNMGSTIAGSWLTAY